MASSQDEVLEQVVDKSESSQDQVPEQEPAKVPDKSPKSEDKITKPKNPGRVAAGKRLAEMNRKNKAMKNPPSENHLNIDWGYVIAGGGLIIAAGSLYYAYKAHQRAESGLRQSSVGVVPRRVENPLPVSAPKTKLMEMEEPPSLRDEGSGVPSFL